MKIKRQNKILEIISNNDIETQEELSKKLKQSGMEATQATISRDIKELRLIKVLSLSGKYKYAVAGDKNCDSESKIAGAVLNSIDMVTFVGNTVVVKCVKGMAQGVCAAIDELKFENVVGSIAGYDTIFILLKREKQAEKLSEELLAML